MKNPELRFFLCLIIQTTSLSNYWVTAQNELATETVRFIPDACGIGLMSYMTYVRKSMYKGTYLQVILNCPDTDEEIKITKIEWRLLSARCFNKLGNTVIDSKTTTEQELQEVCLMLEQDSPANTLGYSQYNKGFSFKNDQKTTLKCSKDLRNITIPFDEAKWVPITTEIPRGAVLRTESDGVYIFVLVVTVESNSVFNYTATITPIARHGHLSAIDFPLLRFYAVMFVVYAIYLIVWLTLCCCYRRDILQVQYWITAVIFLGLLEKTIFLGENDTLNRTGHSSVYGALVFGELMSCAKKTLSRMLVVVVSVGFGIVKPRLGPTLQKVLVVGLVYFIACSVEGGLRVSNDKADITKDTYIPFIVLSVVDAGICGWIVASLVQTMRTLRLRRNLVKLSLYRHFTNTLIFAVIASVAFMLWSIRQHKMTECLTDWKSLWFDEAFWHILSSTFLLIIMILWRPSENNKIYDCINDQDEGYHDSENQGMNFAFDGMQLRSKDDKNETNKENVEANDEKDDLKLQLLEGKMALSLTDSALPSMSDLVEEIVATENEEAKLL